MFREWIAAALAGLMGLGLAACSGGNQVVVIQATPPPAWVDRMPRQKDTLCAVGYSGPTFYQQDCLGNAAESARGHLADTISATIKTITIDISDGTRGMFSRDVFVEGSETASDVVLQGSEVQAQWMDLAGARGAPKGCYAMVCIDPDKPVDEMVKKMEKKLPKKTVEQVRANAEAAFEELEREEGRRGQPSAPPPAPPAPKASEEPADQPPAASPTDDTPADGSPAPAPEADDDTQAPADAPADPGQGEDDAG